MHGHNIKKINKKDILSQFKKKHILRETAEYATSSKETASNNLHHELPWKAYKSKSKPGPKNGWWARLAGS